MKVRWLCEECKGYINEGYVDGQWVGEYSKLGSSFKFLHPECLESRLNRALEEPHPEPVLEGLPIEQLVATIDAELRRAQEQYWLEMEQRAYEEEYYNRGY